MSRLFPNLLRVSMLFCGNFLGQGHVLSREPLSAPVAELLVRTVLDHARRNRLGTVVFKDFAPRRAGRPAAYPGRGGLLPRAEHARHGTAPGVRHLRRLPCRAPGQAAPQCP
ncbi:hypothetical protein GCM10020000_02940 [Streptomyces olivoverticillatus]